MIPEDNNEDNDMLMENNSGEPTFNHQPQPLNVRFLTESQNDFLQQQDHLEELTIEAIRNIDFLLHPQL